MSQLLVKRITNPGMEFHGSSGILLRKIPRSFATGPRCLQTGRPLDVAKLHAFVAIAVTRLIQSGRHLFQARPATKLQAKAAKRL
jgi:hypothetical protein